jgi:hypothetical protein
MKRFIVIFIMLTLIATPISIPNDAIQLKPYSLVKTYHTFLKHIPNYKGMSKHDLWKFYDSLIVDLHSDSLKEVKPFNKLDKDDLTFKLLNKSRVVFVLGVMSKDMKKSNLMSEEIIDTLEAGTYWLEPQGIFVNPGKYFWRCDIDSSTYIQSFHVRPN